MTDTAQCGRCGAPVEVGALFCGRCGVDVTLASGEEATVAMTTGGSPVEPPVSGVTLRTRLRESTLGEYEILDELGRGGMATVFRAHDISLDRKVAIKVMAPHLLEGEGMAERFKLEARTAAQLSHPHIIPIYAVKESGSTLFFVMKYVEGRALDEIIARTGQLPIAMVKDILIKVGGALGYAHRRGVVHRDIKPGNIMIDDEGTPIVTDFGIAKVTAAATGLTVTGTTIGTPSYMSPEQCEAKEVTGASDQYSLGIVAFQMLTGRLPFEGDSAVTVMYKHCHEDLPPLPDYRPDCPPDILETVTRMVAKDPADRWPSMEAAIQKLSLGTSSQAYLDPIREEMVKAAKEGDFERLAELSTGGRGAMTPVGSQTTGPRAAAGGRRWLGAAAVILLLAVAGSVAVLQPWGGTETPLLGAEGDGATRGPTGGDVVAQNPTEVTPGDEASEPAPDEATSVPPARDPEVGAGRPEPSSGAGTPPPPARPVVSEVLVAGLPPRVEPGDGVVLTATPRDRSGTPVPGAGVTWSSSDPSVASVGPDGALTAVAPGTTMVVAASNGVEGRLEVTVEEAPATTLTVTPTTLDLTVGSRERLTAEARTASGTEVAGRPPRWTSSDEAVARVNASGLVEAVGPGRADLTARLDQAEVRVPVTVALDARTAAADLLGRYAAALENNDRTAAQRIFPGMSREEQQAFDGLGALQNLDVTLTIDSFEERGDQATARIRGTYAFSDRSAGDQRLEVGGDVDFARQPDGTWIISKFGVATR